MIKIGVSACLLGNNVRYDGSNKFIELNHLFNQKTYQLCGICPEVEMGMSVPRKPIQIINNNRGLKLVNVCDQRIDHTTEMNTWFKENLKRLQQYQGFILKSKSPSCGNQTTTHYYPDKKQQISDGFFVYLLKQHINNPFIIDENNLNQLDLVAEFKNKLASTRY